MIYIGDTEFVMTQAEADKFTRTHVVISRAAIKQIAALAKKHGIYKELKALDVKMYPLGKGRR